MRAMMITTAAATIVLATTGGAAVAAGGPDGKPDLGRIPGVTTAGTYKYVATSINTTSGGNVFFSSGQCPKGTHVTGGGWSSGGVEQINNSYPLDGGDADVAPDDKWGVFLVNVSASGVNGTVYAICGS